MASKAQKQANQTLAEQVTGHGPRVMGHGSQVMGHGSRVTGHGSWVMGHGSWVQRNSNQNHSHKEQVAGPEELKNKTHELLPHAAEATKDCCTPCPYAARMNVYSETRRGTYDDMNVYS